MKEVHERSAASVNKVNEIESGPTVMPRVRTEQVALKRLQDSLNTIPTMTASIQQTRDRLTVIT